MKSLAVTIAVCGTLLGLPLCGSQKVAAQSADFVTGKTNADLLLGKWCGAQGNYIFSNKRLDVTIHANGQKRVFKIASWNFGDGWVELIFDLPGRKGSSNTAFHEFTKDGTSMAQAANTRGDMGPKMVFRRC